MRTQRQRGTRPELLVRAALRGLRLRYTLANRDLPGSPDLANRSRRFAVFVHGCYWHAHPGCPRATVPKHNRAFWEEKFRQNRARDERDAATLLARGYRVITVWECETKDAGALEARLRDALAL